MSFSRSLALSRPVVRFHTHTLPRAYALAVGVYVTLYILEYALGYQHGLIEIRDALIKKYALDKLSPYRDRSGGTFREGG